MNNEKNRLGIMIDNSRNAVMNIDTVKRIIDLISLMGYDYLMLYTEDTYEVNNQPYFGHLRGRYSKVELKEIDYYAKNHNIELIPCIQTLAHLNGLMRWNNYLKLRDCRDILCIDDERTYELIEDMFSTLRDCFSSKYVNIGMDEAEFTGLGEYRKRFGECDRNEMFLRHIKRVSDIAIKYGFKCYMWSDMFSKLLSELKGGDVSLIKDKIPDNVELIYWDYYSKDKNHYDKMIKEHKKLSDGFIFAGGGWTWTGFAPHNTFALKTNIASYGSLHENGIKNSFITLWGDDGGECSRLSTLPVLYYVSQISRGNFDEEKIKKGFFEAFHIPFDDFMMTELPDTPNCDGEFFYNPDKFMLYNDLFLGPFDCAANSSDAKRYGLCAEKLSAFTDNKEFGYIFNTLKCLCDVLYVKYEAGLKVRKAYKENDRDKLKELTETYDVLLNKVEIFYRAFEYQWMRENKPQGFDIQDIRLGGLKQRIIHCRDRLSRYINGEIDRIEELDEEVLDAAGNINPSHKANFVSNWELSATSNVISHRML